MQKLEKHLPHDTNAIRKMIEQRPDIGPVELIDTVTFGEEKLIQDFGNMTLPFEQKNISENVKIRTFSSDTDSGEFTWHRDREDRIVELIEGENWYIQLDNELPKKLVKEDKIFIPMGVYHRVIKGEGDLKVKIEFVNV